MHRNNRKFSYRFEVINEKDTAPPADKWGFVGIHEPKNAIIHPGGDDCILGDRSNQYIRLMEKNPAPLEMPQKGLDTLILLIKP